MVRSFSMIGALSLALFLAGCKNETESAMSDVTSKTNEMTDVLKGIKDDASAKAALPKIKSIAAELNAAQAKLEKVKPADAESAMKTMEKYGKPLAEATGALMMETLRVGQISPEAAAATAGR